MKNLKEGEVVKQQIYFPLVSVITMLAESLHAFNNPVCPVQDQKP